MTPPDRAVAAEGAEASVGADLAISSDKLLDSAGAGVAVSVTAEHEALRMVSEPLPRVVRRIALPAVASNLLMTLFASVDAYWVGTRIGPQALAAVATSVFWIWMVIAVAEMVSIGLTALAARRHGERRHADAAFVSGDALVLATTLGLLVAACGLLLVPRMFAVMGTPPEVTALGTTYLRTYLLGTPFIYGFFVADATFRASGDTRTPLLLLACATAATLALDPVLILGLGPAPRLGVAGAAVALVATRGVVSIVGLAVLRRRGMLRFRRPDPAVLRGIVRVGLPTAMTAVVFSLIYVGMTRTTTQFGTPALAALGLGHRIESWLYMIGVGFGAAAAAIIGQNLGAGETRRAARTGWLAVGYATVPAIALAIVSVAIPRQIAAIFVNDPVVIDAAAAYLRIAAFSHLFLGAEIVLEGALGGAGDTIPPMLTSTALTALRVPLAAWAASRWGVEGIWWTIALTAAARGVAMAALWRSGRWMRTSL